MWHRGTIVWVDDNTRRARMERYYDQRLPLDFTFDASHRDLHRFIGDDVWVFITGRTAMLHNLFRKSDNLMTRLELLKFDRRSFGLCVIQPHEDATIRCI